MANGPDRVRYAEGQRVRAADLAGEQEYLIALERRHNLTQHAPGIVNGLDVAADWSSARAVSVGAAVDDDGMLQVLERPARIGETCVDVWLIRCDRPQHTRHPGHAPCGPAEFDRVDEHVRVYTEADPDEQPVPPVAGAVYLGRFGCDDPRDRGYTSITESVVMDPGGRAVMQVGPATGRDRNGFVISTADAAGVLAPRVSIDRRGTNRFDGTVEVSGYRAWTTVVLWDSILVVRALRPGSAGERIHVRVQADNDDQLRLRFFDGRNRAGEDLVLPRIEREELEKLIGEYDSELVEFDLRVRRERPIIFGPGVPAVAARAIAANANAPLYSTPADLTLSTRGGSVELAESPVESEANGLSFTALREAPKAPPVPGMWSVRTGTAAEPREELRLDLGEKKDGDISIRFSLGGRSGDVYTEALSIRGTRFVTMPELHVNGGTIQFAPVRADHTDINFTTLLVRAWMDGLAAAIDAATDITLEIADLPALIKTGDPWDYRVLARNFTGGWIKANRLLEIWSVTGSNPLSQPVNVQVNVPPGGAPFEIAHITHDPGQVTPGTLSIEVRVSGKRGDVPWRQKANANATVEASPTIEIDGIPNSVPRDTDWSYQFAVRNNATVDVTLDDVTVTEDAGNINIPVAANIAAGQSLPFGPFPHGGITANFPIAIRANFTWGDASTSVVDADKTVRVRRDLDVSIDVPDAPSAQTPWTYDLSIENDSEYDITITRIRHRLAGLTAWDIVINAGLPLDSPLAEEIDAPEIPGNPAEVDLELEIQYTREPDQTLTITAIERRIPVL